MANRDRTISVKIEKLNSAGKLIETRQDKLITGKVDVSPGYVRRKCSFDLAEALPDDWIAHRWKLYYGYKARGDTDYTYVPLGVFIPINPKQTSKVGGFESSYQGIDKSKLFSAVRRWPVVFAAITFSTTKSPANPSPRRPRPLPVFRGTPRAEPSS